MLYFLGKIYKYLQVHAFYLAAMMTVRFAAKRLKTVNFRKYQRITTEEVKGATRDVELLMKKCNNNQYHFKNLYFTDFVHYITRRLSFL